jgi:hypothetical protein
VQQVGGDGSGEPGVLPGCGPALLQHAGRRIRLR